MTVVAGDSHTCTHGAFAALAFGVGTSDVVSDRPLGPRGALLDRAVAYWRTLVSDPDAVFEREVTIDASTIRPRVTWGTSPDMVATVDGRVPDPAIEPDPVKRGAVAHALDYMGLAAGTPIADIAIDKVFIGSCTNARIEDLRIAADVVRGRRIAPTVRQALVVPGSGLVKAQAEAEGLDRVFVEAASNGGSRVARCASG